MAETYKAAPNDPGADRYSVIRLVAIGMAATIIALLLLSVVMGPVLSHRRVVFVVREALDHGDLPYTTETNNDFVTECALLQMQYFVSGSLVERALVSRIVPPKVLPVCDALKVLVDGNRTGFPTVTAIRYAYGARFLDAPFLAFLSFRSTKVCYQVISYASIVLLLAAMLWRRWQTALLLSPISVLLLYAFGLHVFGKNLSHAPSFFVGILGIALFIAIPAWFGEARRRYLFYGVLAVVCFYFDLLNGAIPFLFGLTLIGGYFFYLRPEVPGKNTFGVALREAVIVGLAFLVGYALSSIVRLGLLAILGFYEASDFLHELAFRLSTTSDNGTVATIPEVIERLWSARFQLTPGGAGPASWALYLGFAAWIFAGMACLTVLLQRRAARLIGDVFVLGLAGGGIIVWLLILRGHTYQHFLFAVRPIALTCGCGIAAALLAVEALAYCGIGWFKSTVLGVASLIAMGVIVNSNR